MVSIGKNFEKDGVVWIFSYGTLKWEEIQNSLT